MRPTCWLLARSEASAQGRERAARVEVLGAVMEVAGTGVKAGDQVRVVVRPEAIEIGRSPVGAGQGVDLGRSPSPLGEGRGGGCHFTATVTSRVFLGEKIEYHLDVAGTSILAVRYNAGAGDTIQEGATVGVRVIEDAASLLPKEGA